MVSPSAGTPALKYGDVNTETTSPGEVKGLNNLFKYVFRFFSLFINYFYNYYMYIIFILYINSDLLFYIDFA